MNKEPIGLYIFRFILGFGLFAFMCMTYWSTVLIEQNIKTMHSDVAHLKNDIYQLKSETSKVRDDVLQSILNEQKNWQELLRFSKTGDNARKIGSIPQPVSLMPFMTPTQNGNNPNIDPTLPNLLQEDPFYAVTLPKILPNNFKPHGTLQRAALGKPHNLHPFSGWSHISSWNSLCSVSVSKMLFGKYETMAPNMAIKLEERENPKTGIPEFWIHLRNNVFWEPLDKKFFPNMNIASHFLRRHQVTAEDFKFYFDAVMNPFVQEPGAISLRNYLDDIQEIEVVDKLTFIVRWKTQKVKGADGIEQEKIKYIAKQWTGNLQPLASFVYKYFADGNKIVENDADPNTYRTNSVWAQNFSQHWAKNIIPSCGAWVFDGMSDRQIRFRRNGNFYNPLAALAENIIVSFKSTPDAFWQSFKAESLDTYSIQPDQLIELDDFFNSPQYIKQADKNNAINRLDYLARSYSYIGWNQNTPYFNNKKVRQAMTMAIDRQRIISQNLNGLGEEITGTFFRHSPSYDQSIDPWPFDPQRARLLLEEEGWYDSNGDGTIDKLIDGKRVPFEFALTYYVKNQTAKAIADYIATALKEIGITCNLNGIDIADLSAKFEEKSFDAIYLGWSLGTPPEDPKQLWHSAGAKQQGSSNAVGFNSQEADQIIERLQYEYNPTKRIELYHRFNAIIHEEQPYTFLYAPKTALLYRDYLQNVFIPAERQDLIPGANVAEPDTDIFWLNKKKNQDQ
ncbi:MAG: ABC transporter substrate-binding protein [Chlamydiota bacterium]|nr:ABC transporter substrate-binding protein [Chlamydiota bacterium]